MLTNILKYRFDLIKSSISNTLGVDKILLHNFLINLPLPILFLLLFFLKEKDVNSLIKELL